MTSRLVKKAVVALVGALVLAAAPLNEARATSFANLTVAQFTDASDYIVRGEVQQVWTEVDGNGRVWTRARLRVTDTLKGPDKPTELVVDSLGGTHGTQELHVPGQAVFSEHEDLFVFLTRMGNGRLVPIGKFMGKYSIRKAPDDTREHIVRYHPREGLTFDARFIPHPSPADRVYLDDLLAQVHDRLDRGWDGQPIPGISPEKLETINTLERRMPR